MGEHLLIGYSELKDTYSILGCGSLEDMQDIALALKGTAMLKVKVVDKPTDKTLQELVSNSEYLKEIFGYIKDLPEGFHLEKEETDTVEDELF